MGIVSFRSYLREDRETPLIVAIRAGNTSAVELLVRRGTRFDDGDVGIRQRTEQGRLLASTARRLVDR